MCQFLFLYRKRQQRKKTFAQRQQDLVQEEATLTNKKKWFFGIFDRWKWSQKKDWKNLETKWTKLKTDVTKKLEEKGQGVTVPGDDAGNSEFLNPENLDVESYIDEEEKSKSKESVEDFFQIDQNKSGERISKKT